MKNILIVDDEKDLLETLSKFLKSEKYIPLTADSAEKALMIIKETSPDMAIVDLKIRETDGITLLQKIKELDEEIPVIILTAYGSIQSSVEAMKCGAGDYLTKPIDNYELLHVIKRTLETAELKQKVHRLETLTARKEKPIHIVDESNSMKGVISLAKQVAQTDMTVLIVGESGTGKEVIASYIYQQSHRVQKPFTVVDCGSIPENLIESELFGYEKGAFTDAVERKQGLLEIADTGTLFLDEISNLPLTSQAKLLRVLETCSFRRLGGCKEIKIDVRFLAATNVNLTEMVEKGGFRNDLYNRITQFVLLLEPLRLRQEDIIPLAVMFLEEANKEFHRTVKSFSNEVIEMFRDYKWPGNIRELKNTVLRLVLLCEEDIVDLKYLQHSTVTEGRGLPLHSVDVQSKTRDANSETIPLHARLEQMEREMITEALAKAGGNKYRAAKILNIDRKTLYKKLEKWRIGRIGDGPQLNV